jgi:inositol-phosphate transport system substrate-binding protein
MRLTHKLAAAAVSAALLASAVSAPTSAEEVFLNVWSLQSVSGPLRGGNLITAASRLNKALEEERSETRVTVLMRQGPGSSFDDDAQQLLKVFGIGRGPDVFVAAHEWTCAFANDGFALNLEAYIPK